MGRCGVSLCRAERSSSLYPRPPPSLPLRSPVMPSSPRQLIEHSQVPHNARDRTPRFCAAGQPRHVRSPASLASYLASKRASQRAGQRDRQTDRPKSGPQSLPFPSPPSPAPFPGQPLGRISLFPPPPPESFQIPVPTYLFHCLARCNYLPVVLYPVHAAALALKVRLFLSPPLQVERPAASTTTEDRNQCHSLNLPRPRREIKIKIKKICAFLVGRPEGAEFLNASLRPSLAFRSSPTLPPLSYERNDDVFTYSVCLYQARAYCNLLCLTIFDLAKEGGTPPACSSFCEALPGKKKRKKNKILRRHHNPTMIGSGPHTPTLPTHAYVVWMGRRQRRDLGDGEEEGGKGG